FKTWTLVTIGVGAVVAAPYALGAIGFTQAGIAASSIAAKMMSVAAISNGGGIAAGGVVATLHHQIPHTRLVSSAGQNNLENGIIVFSRLHSFCDR
uniref:Uncharacterized protein n=1 Tax=Mastacembelus armatus TaxID=205130 RepID=A0A3Q3LVL2_9TELE